MDPFTLTALVIGKFLLGKGAAVGAAKVVGYSAMAGAATGAAVVIAVAYWSDIKSWFERRKHSHGIDNHDTVARVIVDKLSNGDYRVIKAVFRKSTDTYLDSDTQECSRLDSTLAEKHRNSRIVDYYI